MTFEQFLGDPRTQDAVVRNFEIIGGASPLSRVAWKLVAGVRDIMAHGHYRIDYESLWEIITTRIPGFRKDIVKILKEDSQRGNEALR